MIRPIIFIAISLLIISGLLLFQSELPDLADLKAHLADLTAWRERAPFASAWLTFTAYTLVAALSIPVAAIMTLGIGALFGFVQGLLIVSFASSLGALLAFLGARTFLRDAVEHRFGSRLHGLYYGFKRDGAFYLFTLRLIPVFPFFLVNLAMGLTQLRAWTFYWVSQAGMLSGTIVYVNAGTQIVQINAPSDVLSPTLIGSLALLGLLPWFGKFVIYLWRKRRIYRHFKKPKHFDRNLIVVGAGAAGLVSTYIAAAVKAKVTLVEAHKMGGDCLNYGCVPSKALIKSSKIVYQSNHAERYGLTSQHVDVSFQKIMTRIEHVIEKIAPHDSIERYTALGAEVLRGHARVIDPWTVEIKLNDGDTIKLTTRSIIVATGARPSVPNLPGIDQTGYVTSENLWQKFSEYDQPPRRLVVLGGGPIGTELAQAFARLGSDVTQVEKAPRLLAKEDADVSDFAKQTLEADGVTVLTECIALRCVLDNGEKSIEVEHDGTVKKFIFDELICAVGREARLSGFGLEELEIPVQRTIETNNFLQTNYPNIYAAGDVVGPFQFTHVAAHQAWYASVNALFGMFRKFQVDYRVIPWTIFTDPEIARVGLNEQEARQQGIQFEITRFDLGELDRAITESATRGFIKVLTPPGKDTILGVTIVGEHAGDLIAEFVLAMKYRIGLSKILSTPHAYPTFAEANKYVAGAWKRAHISERSLKMLEWFHNWQRGT